MADDEEFDSILASYVAQRRRTSMPNAALTETAAIALDVNTMIAYVAPLLELICETPAIKAGPYGAAIRSLLESLKKLADSHIDAMAELNRGR